MTTGLELAIMQSHADGISSLALSGSLLVSGCFDNTVKLWDTRSMQLVRTLSGHSEYVLSVAVSSDGRRVLSGGGDRDFNVHVWDAASGAQLAVLQGHSKAVRCITVSSDGQLAASASYDSIVCVWDLVSLSLCAKLEGHLNGVCSVLFV